MGCNDEGQGGSGERRYFVQVLLVKEVEVTATDELQAERAAYATLGRDKHNAIGLWVAEEGTALDAGALSDDLVHAMDFVRKHFHTLSREWCENG